MSTEEKWVSATPIFASGEYLAQMCNEIDRLRAEVAQLREERDRYRAVILSRADHAEECGSRMHYYEPSVTDLNGCTCELRALTPTGGDHA